ncbi:MAG TPA: alpha/beta hydrolase, partial [Candidatus Binatia bacterium]|nr:alpha/beta hydrolase [Candidatus Binatia bacterium]
MALEPEIQAFADESDRLFGPDYGRLPIGEQRRLYNNWCRHFSAPFPSDVIESELTVPGPDVSIRAKLFRPSGAGAAPLPVIVFYHGGGWVLGSPETHAMATAAMVQRTGAAVLSVDYRLAPEHPFPAAFDDAYAALLWVAGSGPRHGLDPTRIAVAGDSAGGNLAAGVSLVATREGGRRPAAQMLIYPVTDLANRHASYRLFAEGFFLTAAEMEWYIGHYLPNRSAARDPRASPLLAPDLSGLPSALVLTAGFDPLRDEGEAYAARLEAAGVRVWCRRFPGLVHGFCNTTSVIR